MKIVTVSQGKLGLTVEKSPHGGVVITAIKPTCTLRNIVSIDDRIVTLDGKQITKVEDLSQSNDRLRQLGIVPTSSSSNGQTEDDIEKEAIAIITNKKRKHGGTEYEAPIILSSWKKICSVEGCHKRSQKNRLCCEHVSFICMQRPSSCHLPILTLVLPLLNDTLGRAVVMQA